MLKSKSKKIISIILVILILLISGVSFATNEIMPISENPDIEEYQEELEDNEQEITDTLNEIINGNVEDGTESENQNGLDEADTSDWVNEDAYIFSNDIEINKIVDGNAFVVGNTVTVTGEIGGDLFVIANKLVIEDGYVYSGIFALANEIEVNGVVYDLYACANKITIGENGYIYRDFRGVSDVVNLEGLVKRNVYLTVNKINFKEDVGAVISGNLDYSSPELIEVPQGAVTGQVTYNKDISGTIKSTQSSILSYIGSLVRELIYALIIILLTLWFAPKFTEKLFNTTGKKVAISFGVGVLAFLILAFISMILLVSVLGMSILLTLLVTFGLIVCISKSIFAMTISRMITNKFKIQGKVKYTLISLLLVAIIWALGLIPFGVGLIIELVVEVIGTGLVLTNIVNKKDKNNEKAEKQEVATEVKE